MIFQSTFRRTALSSLHVQRNRGSNALQFSHFGWMYACLYSSTCSESHMLGCVAILVKLDITKALQAKTLGGTYRIQVIFVALWPLPNFQEP